MSSSTYSSERSSRYWDTSGTAPSDLSTSDGRLFVVVTRETDTAGLDLTCYSFALAFMVVTVVAMVVFAARQRRRFLDEEGLLEDSADGDGVQGEAALRKASDRKRKEAVSVARSSGTSRRPMTEVAVAGRRARGGVPVNIFKSTPRRETLTPSGNRRPTRKSIGEPHDDELAWNRKKTARKADVNRKSNDWTPWKIMTTAELTPPAVIFTLKRTPHRRPYINFAVTTAKTAEATSTSAASFTTAAPPSTVIPRFPSRTAIQVSRTGAVTSFRADSATPEAPFIGGFFRDLTGSSVVPTTQRSLAPIAETGLAESTMPSSETKEDGVRNDLVIAVPLTTRLDLPKIIWLDKTSRGAASASPNRTAKASPLDTDKFAAHTEPFADDGLNYLA